MRKEAYCPDCYKKFSSKYAVDKHQNQKRCFSISSAIQVMEQDQLIQFRNEIDKKLGSPSSPPNSPGKNLGVINNNNNTSIQGDSNTINNNTIQANNNITINLVNLGQESIEALKNKEFYEELIKTIEYQTFNTGSLLGDCHRIYEEQFRKAILKVFEKVHCNKDFPEHHNLYITNKKSYEPFHVFRDDEWKKNGDLKTIEEVMNHSKTYLIDLIDWLIENHNEESTFSVEFLITLKSTIKKDISHLLEVTNHKDFIGLRKDIFRTAHENQSTLRKSFDMTQENYNDKPILNLTNKK